MTVGAIRNGLPSVFIEDGIRVVSRNVTAHSSADIFVGSYAVDKETNKEEVIYENEAL